MSADLEFLVVEGQGRGDLFPLQADQIELGRKDPFAKNESPSRISFPDPTVSGVHATLTWDSKRNRFLLTHRSSTNHTLINGKVVQGTQYIHVGDKIKMGGLVVQLRLVPKAAPLQAEVPAPARHSTPRQALVSDTPANIHSAFQLLILNGPDAGRLHPIQQETLILQEPGSVQTFEPTLNIHGAAATRCLLLYKPPEIHVTCAETGARPILLDTPLGGVVRQRSPGPEFGNILTSQSLLLVGGVAVILVRGDAANDARTRLLAGEQVSPLQGGLFHEGDRLWNRGEQHLLRFTAGPLKGTHFWVDHRKMERPISLGRIGQKTLVELTDRGAVQCEMTYRDETMILSNVDGELNLPLNGEEVAPGQSQELSSGDCFRLGRTVIRYEYLPLQARINTYSLFLGARELPLRRTVNLIGNGPHCEIKIDDERLSALTGRLVVTETSLRYQHRQAGLMAMVQGQEVRAGQEATLRLDNTIQFCEGLSLRLGRRTSVVDDVTES